MEIFEFKKSLPVRLEECMLVLSWSDKLIPASQVRDEWSYFIQVQIEPAGWQALWKIPRTICEDLKIQYPTVVFGMVEHTTFKDLKAIFSIQAVEENNIHLPERQEVNLEDLYPTLIQENSALNIEKTAECIDSLRFFYKNIWMPWDYDNDDDLDWARKHLESRLQFHYDLQKKAIKRSVAIHIRTLLHEAKYIQDRKQYLEMDLSDDDELEESVSKTNVTDLMKMHLRLTIIKNEIELLENHQIRKIYEDLKSDKKIERENFQEIFKVFLIIKPCTLTNQEKIFKLVKQFISESQLMHICPTLQEALHSCEENDQIYLSSGIYSIKAVESLNDNGIMCGLSSIPENLHKLVINSMDFETFLFMFDGNFTLKNLTIDCTNVRTGIVVKSGIIKIINCHIIGDSNSSTKQGIYVSGSSSLIIEDSRIENFAIGLKLVDNSSVTLRNTDIKGCFNAIEINDKNTVNCEKITISNCKTVGIVYESRNLNITDDQIILKDFNEMKSIKIPCMGNCVFLNNLHNIIVYNRKLKTFKEVIQDSDESFELNLDENYKNLNSSVETTRASETSLIEISE